MSENGAAAAQRHGHMEVIIVKIIVIGPRERSARRPPWISETLAALKMDPNDGIRAAACARAYVEVFEGSDRGKTIDARVIAKT